MLTLEEFVTRLEEFVEDFQLYEEPDEPYRNGYRRGYYDALTYVLEWVEEDEWDE
jgi:hypothetical protein